MRRTWPRWRSRIPLRLLRSRSLRWPSAETQVPTGWTWGHVMITIFGENGDFKKSMFWHTYNRRIFESKSPFYLHFWATIFSKIITLTPEEFAIPPKV
jgi:hypothetical protein